MAFTPITGDNKLFDSRYNESNCPKDMTNLLNESVLLTSVSNELSADLSQVLAKSEVLNVEESTDLMNAELTPVTKCCLKKKCYEKVLANTQNDLFNCFWRIGDYAKQNYFLVGLMAAQSPKQVTSRPLKKNKTLSWKYWVDIRGRKVQVCKGFFLAVYGVSDKRLRVLQTKLVNGEPLEDQRGKYDKEKRANQHTVKRKLEATNTLSGQTLQTPVGGKSGKKKKIMNNEINSTLINSNGILLNEIIIPQNFLNNNI